MIRNLLATTAIATLVATGAVAQTTTPSVDPPVQEPTQTSIRAEGHLASNIMGKSVYNGTGDAAENIGKVNDIVLDKDGNVQAVVVGVGGFLGIGQKEVALEYDLVEWAETDGDRWLVVETTADTLKAQQDFDRSAYRPMPLDADVAETPPATAEDLAKAPQADTEGQADGDMAATEQPADGTEDRPADQTAAVSAEDREQAGDMAATDDQQAAEADDTQTAAIDRPAQQKASPDQLRADNLMGTAVYGANDERVGEIGDVVLTPESEVEAVLVDVGGFLGIDEKEVAISMENLVFMTDEGGDLFLYTELTEEQIDAQPAYDETTYAEQRENMLLRIQ